MYVRIYWINCIDSCLDLAYGTNAAHQKALGCSHLPPNCNIRADGTCRFGVSLLDQSLYGNDSFCSFVRYLNEQLVEQSSGVELTQRTTEDTIEREASLTLKSVSLDESAIVKAVASNVAGKADTSSRLSVESECYPGRDEDLRVITNNVQV